MPRLIQRCYIPAIWSCAELMSDSWSVCLPHHCEVNERALFLFKQTQLQSDPIQFYCASGSGVFNQQQKLKRVHEAVEEAKRTARQLKKFVLHFEASDDLLNLIELKADAEFVRKYFICIGSDSPLHGESLLTFFSADTDCVFKCVPISNAACAVDAIRVFIQRGEYMPQVSDPSDASHQRTAFGKKSKSDFFESDQVDSVVLFGQACSDLASYYATKEENIRILEKCKLAQTREAIYILQSDMSTFSHGTAPVDCRVMTSVDAIYHHAGECARELSDMHRHSAGLQVGTAEYTTQLYFPVIRPVVSAAGAASLTLYLCRFILNCVARTAISDNACIPDSFWHAFPASCQVPRCLNNAMRTKKENVDGEAFRNNFTLLAPGLEMYSTLRQQLAATDSSVSLILVFRDEAFRFKESDSLALVFKFAFLVCSNHQFDTPPLSPCGHEVQLQSSSCLATAAAASPRHLQLVICTDGRRRVITYPYPQKGVTVGSVWTGVRNRSKLVTVAINDSPPPEEQPDADDDDTFYLGSGTDEDEDF